MTETMLALATSHVNSTIRGAGLSAFEILLQRNQFDGTQMPVEDRAIVQQRYDQRLQSHLPSARYKARGKTSPVQSSLKEGDLVYLKTDRDKTKARDRYLVVATDGKVCSLHKFKGHRLHGRRYTVSVCDCSVIQPSVPEADPASGDQSDSESSGCG